MGTPHRLPIGALLYSACWGQALSGCFRHPSGNAARGSAPLFGISGLALPAWDQGDGAEQSDARPGCEFAAGTRVISNALRLRSIATVDGRPIGSAPERSLHLV